MVDQNALIDPALVYFGADPNATDGWKLLQSGAVNDAGYRFQNRTPGLSRAYRLDPPAEEGSYWTIVDLGNPGGDNGTAATGINNSGDVTGYSVAVDGKYHMFLVLGDDENAVMHDLGSFQGSDTLAYDISNRVGDRIYIVGRTMSRRAILCTCLIGESGISHEYQDLGTLKTDDSGLAEAYGVNDQGQVVGYATANPSKGDTPERAFSYTNLGMVSLGTLSTHKTWNDSYAYSVNNTGVVVGQYSTVFPSFAPFYYSPATGMVDLLQSITNRGVLSNCVTPSAINDNGVICGPRVTNYHEYDGEAFILVPNPPL
jgi:probable HAF family extracellular repeat protein